MKNANENNVNKARALLLCVLFVIFSPNTFAQNSPDDVAVGKIIIVSGEVVATDQAGSSRQLQRRSEVFVGDIITTLENSSAQLRMIDSAQISLREATEFAILDYHFEDQSPDNVSDLELLVGGFRTITGSIGDQNREAYTARAAQFGTIGIRGTVYEVAITTDGQMLTGVYEGGTTVTNDFGELDIGLDADYDFAEVADTNSPPVGILIQPPGLGDIAIVILEEESDDGGDSDNDGADGNAGGVDGDNVDTAADADGGNVVANVADADGGNVAANDGAGAVGAINLTGNPVVAANITTSQDQGDTSDSLSLNLPPLPITAQNASTNSSRTDINEVVRTNIAISPNETSGDGSVSCANGLSSAFCLNFEASSADGGSSNSGDNSGGADVGNDNGVGTNVDPVPTTDPVTTPDPGTTTDPGTVTDSGTTTGTGNSNNGNGNTDPGNSNNGNTDPGNSNSGNGNSQTVTQTASIQLSTADKLHIAWGKWDNPVAENWVLVNRSDGDLTRISTSQHMADLTATPVANLQGTHSYASSDVSSFIGSGSAGSITNLEAGFEVDFETGAITNGNLMLLVSDQSWAIDFDGSIVSGAVSLNPLAGELSNIGGIISNEIDASIGGVFTGENAEAFVGGFDLIDAINPINFVDGIYTIER